MEAGNWRKHMGDDMVEVAEEPQPYQSPAV
jgi:hypothetical protein